MRMMYIINNDAQVCKENLETYVRDKQAMAVAAKELLDNQTAPP